VRPGKLAALAGWEPAGPSPPAASAPPTYAAELASHRQEAEGKLQRIAAYRAELAGQLAEKEERWQAEVRRQEMEDDRVRREQAAAEAKVAALAGMVRRNKQSDGEGGAGGGAPSQRGGWGVALPPVLDSARPQPAVYGGGSGPFRDEAGNVVADLNELRARRSRGGEGSAGGGGGDAATAEAAAFRQRKQREQSEMLRLQIEDRHRRKAEEERRWVGSWCVYVRWFGGGRGCMGAMPYRHTHVCMRALFPH
jgi:hypothetical protein